MTAATTPNGKHYAYIASLRGIAALCVLAFHTAVLTNPTTLPPSWLAPYVLSGNMAVSLFYCLSAFTLALTFDRSDGSVGAFYLRRFFRIAPLFYVVTAFYVVSLGFTDARAILQNITFVFNFDASATNYRGIATGAWSIGVEMPFYLVFPLFFRYASTLRRAVNLTLAFLVISFVFRLALSELGSSGLLLRTGIVPPVSYVEFAGQSLYGNLLYFGFGFIAYRALELFKDMPASKRSAFGYALVVAAGIATIALPQLHGRRLDNPIPLTHVFGLVFAAGIVGLGLFPWGIIVNRATEACGDISYSLYLVHIIVVRLMAEQLERIYFSIHDPLIAYATILAIVLIVSIAAAYLTYTFIERPGIALGRRIESRYRSARSARRDATSVAATNT